MPIDRIECSLFIPELFDFHLLIKFLGGGDGDRITNCHNDLDHFSDQSKLCFTLQVLQHTGVVAAVVE